MNAPVATVLVVEDEKHIRRFLRAALEDEGYAVLEAETGRQGLIDAGTRRPDLLILDLGLPDMDGCELIRDLRDWCTAPLIVLSARADEGDKVAALNLGADDYLSKPFGVPELLARIRAHLRRRQGQGGGGDSECRLGEVVVNLAERSVQRRGLPVHLTPIEYRMLATLIRNAGKVLTHRQLLLEIWGPSYCESSHYLRVHMAHLRQKLEADPTQPEFLLTETGVGYRLAWKQG